MQHSKPVPTRKAYWLSVRLSIGRLGFGSTATELIVVELLGRSVHLNHPDKKQI